MLRAGKAIRLTAPEVERFIRLTGFEPGNVKSLADLDAYVAVCKHYYRGRSRDAAVLRRRIDRQRARCLAAVP